MTTPTPAAPSATLPATRHPAFLAHVRAWFARDVEPGLDDLRVTAAKVREIAPHLQSLANVVVMLAKADPGISPEVVADAVKAAEVVARIAAELAASGV